MKKISFFVCLSLAIVSFGFSRDPDSTLKELKKSVALGNAKEIKTEIFFTAGELNINGSSNQLSDGSYRFYLDKWKPEITYTETNQLGYLKIRAIEDRVEKNYEDRDNCIWDISLNKKVKNDLKVKVVAGKCNINLPGCDLKRFEFSMLAGEMIINLKNTSVPDFVFKAMAGSAMIDLSGKWNNNLNAIIKGGVGEITLKLPAHTGVKFNITSILGEVNAPGLHKQINSWTNDLFGKTKECLYIDFTGGIGNVNVILVD